MENVNKPDKIIVHHSASPRDTTNVAEINQWHLERGFTKSRLGYRVGYHYVIHGNGVIVQTRENDEEGCHTIGQNLTSIGICLTGNFDTELPSDAQESALSTLLYELCGRYKIPYLAIFPHRVFAKKSCYGTLLAGDWAQKLAEKKYYENLQINKEKKNMENRTFSVFTLINKESGATAIVTPHTFGDGYVLFAKVTSEGRSEDEATFVRFENPDKDFATMTNAVYRIEEIV